MVSLGALLSLVSALTFAFNNAAARRGVLTGSVAQAMAFTVPIGVPIFLLALVASGSIDLIGSFSGRSVALLSVAGVIHFFLARYCNYRATKAIGANLVAPVQQIGLVVTLALAVWVLDERLTPLRVIGIVLVAIGPWLTQERKDHPSMAFLGNGPGYHAKLTEGYLYAFLSAVGYGISPILIRLAFEADSIGLGLAGGTISYLAATVAILISWCWPGQWRHVRATAREPAKWFILSGIAVCISQVFRYMALAIAPVSVVTPIQRLSIIFRLYFGWALNREHEAFGGRVVLGTVLSLLGVLALSISADVVREWLQVSPLLEPLAAWH